MDFASNPWIPETRLNDSSQIISLDKVIDIICVTLENWPGHEYTFLLSGKEYIDDGDSIFDRLIRTLTGYGLIPDETMPFENPVKKEAQNQLKLSLTLDNISPLFFPNCGSLRSELLLLDMVYHNKRNSEQQMAKNQMRNYVQLLLGWIIARFVQEDENIINEAIQCKLTRLFILLFGDGDKVPDLLLKECIEIAKDIENSTIIQNEYSAVKKIYDNPPEFSSITVEFHRIQTWFNKMSIPVSYFNGANGILQRFPRGGSILLESIFSGLRRTIINRHGVSSILIDGGGRISIISKRDDAEKTKRWLDKEFFKLLDLGSHIDYRFKGVMDKWRTQLIKQQDVGRSNLKEKYNQINRWLLCCGLPEHSITIKDIETNTLNSQNENFNINEIRNRLNSIKIPRKWISWHPEESEVDEETLLFMQSLNISNKNDPLWQGFISNDSQDDISVNINKYMKGTKTQKPNPMHLLVWLLGHHQRKLDAYFAGLENTTDGQNFIKRNNNNRPVLCLLHLDFNAMGLLLKSSVDPDGIDLFQSSILMQRRSHRLTTIWLLTISEWLSNIRSSQQHSSDDSNEDPIDNYHRFRGDVAVWVLGGDDLTLAIYGEGTEENDRIIDEQEIKWFYSDSLNELHELLSNYSDTLSHELSMTFSAGLSFKNDPSTKLKNIISSSQKAEKNCKAFWRGTHEEKFGMIIDEPFRGKSVDQGIIPNEIHRIGSSNISSMVSVVQCDNIESDDSEELYFGSKNGPYEVPYSSSPSETCDSEFDNDMTLEEQIKFFVFVDRFVIIHDSNEEGKGNWSVLGSKRTREEIIEEIQMGEN
ncbi:MAG: hypothetical protein HOE69_00040 [Euryarchaeota archaeon]|jgi:hypothetical protein|nr:hypothetical protein [Euryarchaeota archaeon]